jgi:hypothetical protein
VVQRGSEWVLRTGCADEGEVVACEADETSVAEVAKKHDVSEQTLTTDTCGTTLWTCRTPSAGRAK